MKLDWKKNLGTFDRIVRVMIGLYLLSLFFSQALSGFWAAAAIVLALFQFLEAALAY